MKINWVSICVGSFFTFLHGGAASYSLLQLTLHQGKADEVFYVMFWGSMTLWLISKSVMNLQSIQLYKARLGK